MIFEFHVSIKKLSVIFTKPILSHYFYSSQMPILELRPEDSNAPHYLGLRSRVPTLNLGKSTYPKPHRLVREKDGFPKVIPEIQ